MEPSDRYRRSLATHSSCRSIMIAPMSRMTEASLGKMPATRLLRLISLLTRSKGLVDHTFLQCEGGKAVNASTSSFASSINGPSLGKRAANSSRVLSHAVFRASGLVWVKMVRNAAAT